MEFIIYRESWRRGGGSPFLTDNFGVTNLCNDLDYMCCLGQMAYQCGTPIKVLVDRAYPEYIPFEFRGMLAEAGLLCAAGPASAKVYGNSHFSTTAAKINDVSSLTEEEREKTLIELAEEAGHTLKFVDGVAPWFKKEEEAA